MIKKNAFTMAEVLITISLIGVVAAITIPSLMSNYQKRVKITKAQKAKYEVTQAAGYIQAQHPRWRGDNASTVSGYFTGILNNSENATFTYEEGFSAGKDGCSSGDLVINVQIDKNVTNFKLCTGSSGAVADNTQNSITTYTDSLKNKNSSSSESTDSNK